MYIYIYIHRLFKGYIHIAISPTNLRKQVTCRGGGNTQRAFLITRNGLLGHLRLKKIWDMSGSLGKIAVPKKRRFFRGLFRATEGKTRFFFQQMCSKLVYLWLAIFIYLSVIRETTRSGCFVFLRVEEYTILFNRGHCFFFTPHGFRKKKHASFHRQAQPTHRYTTKTNDWTQSLRKSKGNLFSKASIFWSILFFQDAFLRISFCFASSTSFCHLRFSDFCADTEFFMLKFFSPQKIPTVTADFLDSWKYWRFNFYALDFTHHAFRLLQKSCWLFLQTVGVKPPGFHFWEFLGFFAAFPRHGRLLGLVLLGRWGFTVENCWMMLDGIPPRDIFHPECVFL